MSKHMDSSESQGADPAEQKPGQRAISDPREVAAVVMSRMNLVRAKKEELNQAVNALVDITRQLTRAYAEQLITIEQLRRLVKELEAAAAPAPHCTGLDASSALQ